MLVVGPACVLTHATAGISFIALQFSDSDLIRTFGEAGLVATIIALIAVLSLVPVFGVLLVRNEQVFAAKFQSADAGVNALRRFCYWIAVRMVGRPGLFSLIARAGRRRARRHLRQSGAALPAGRSGAGQAAGGGGQRPARRQADRRQSDRRPDRIPQGRSRSIAPETLQTIADVHAMVEKQAGVGNVWSLETLRRWLAEKAGSNDVATLKEYVDVIPEHLVRRFISADQDAVVVSGRVPDLDSSEILPVVEKLDGALERRAQGASGLRDRGHRPVGDRRAQQRQHDRQAQPRR